MQPYLPFIYTAIGSLVIGFLLGIWTNRLTASREAEGRRRVFRGKLRSLVATLQSTRGMLISDAYRKSIPEIRDLSAGLTEDISWWWCRRRKFEAACLAYCSLKESEVNPSSVKGFIDDSVSNDERRRRHDAARSLVCDRLQRLIKCA